jgi:hypothetical protein
MVAEVDRLQHPIPKVYGVKCARGSLEYNVNTWQSQAR